MREERRAGTSEYSPTATSIAETADLAAGNATEANWRALHSASIVSRLRLGLQPVKFNLFSPPIQFPFLKHFLFHIFRFFLFEFQFQFEQLVKSSKEGPGVVVPSILPVNAPLRNYYANKSPRSVVPQWVSPRCCHVRGRLGGSCASANCLASFNASVPSFGKFQYLLYSV